MYSFRKWHPFGSFRAIRRVLPFTAGTDGDRMQLAISSKRLSYLEAGVRRVSDDRADGDTNLRPIISA